MSSVNGIVGLLRRSVTSCYHRISDSLVQNYRTRGYKNGFVARRWDCHTLSVDTFLFFSCAIFQIFSSVLLPIYFPSFPSLLRPSQASHLALKTIRSSFQTVFKVTSAPKFCGLYRKPLFFTILPPFFFYYCEKDEGAISWNISYKILCFERAIAAVISFECGNGPSGCIKRGRFQYLFKQDSAPRTWLMCS